MLVDALRALARAPRADIDETRSALGVWVWAALLRRDLLSIPQCLFSFIERHQGLVVPWWPSARRELLCMSYTVLAMFTDLGAPLSNLICVSDAMGAPPKMQEGSALCAHCAAMVRCIAVSLRAWSLGLVFTWLMVDPVDWSDLVAAWTV